MISVPFAAALTASVLSTSFISGVFGMAGGMILIGFLLSFMPLAPAMALHGITQIAANAARAWLCRPTCVLADRPPLRRRRAGRSPRGGVRAGHTHQADGPNFHWPSE